MAMCQSTLSEETKENQAPNVVVSKDGDGQYMTLGEAVNNIPNPQQGRYVIYIKSGTYDENVVIQRSTITLLGDGDGKTIIRSSRNNQDGYGIKDSAAVVILGSNFIVKDISFENTSDPSKGQAVALRSDGDKNVFYHCGFKGHQDTLFVDGQRQFFRECNVQGTIDFIFGDAAMVLQDCCIKFRQPLSGQSNVITAQGRQLESSKTAISVHSCTITGSEEFKRGSVKCYLGRPWKKFSRTIIMQSRIDDIIDPAGWLAWNDYSDTLVYREYDNGGSGSSTANRVSWKGYKVITDPEEAKEFTVGAFIDGDEWLPSTGVPYVSGLM